MLPTDLGALVALLLAHRVVSPLCNNTSAIGVTADSGKPS
jgi:hypothetical protein